MKYESILVLIVKIVMVHVILVNILILYILLRHFDVGFRVPCRAAVDDDFFRIYVFCVF